MVSLAEKLNGNEDKVDERADVRVEERGAEEFEEAEERVESRADQVERAKGEDATISFMKSTKCSRAKSRSKFKRDI